MIVEHAVPMRDGRQLGTLAVSPLGHAAERRAFIGAILASFDDPERVGTQVPVDVVVKKQNTERFLDAALRHYEALVAFEVEQFRAAMTPEDFAETFGEGKGGGDG